MGSTIAGGVAGAGYGSGLTLSEGGAYMRRLLLVITAMLTVSAAGQLAIPQHRGKGPGQLAGVVLGPDDKPVPYASISYQSSAGMAPHAVSADAHGHFVITKLKADNYDLRASNKGVFSEWEKNVTVHSGGTKSVTLRLIYAREIPKAYTKKKRAEP